MTEEDIKSILVDIRENQKLSLQKQDEHIALAQQQLDRAKRQIDESIELQREAIAKQRMIFRLAIPGLLVCLAMIAYLMMRYF